MTKALSAKATVIPARRSRDAGPRQPPAAQHLPVKRIVCLLKPTLMFNKFFSCLTATDDYDAQYYTGSGYSDPAAAYASK